MHGAAATSDYGYFRGRDELSWNDGVATFTDSKGTLKFDSFSPDSKTGDAYLNGESFIFSNQTYKHIIIKENNMYISPELANVFFVSMLWYTADFNIIFGTPTAGRISIISIQIRTIMRKYKKGM